MSTQYHVIEPSGVVFTAKWEGRLEDEHMPFEQMHKLLGTADLERLAVIWPGRQATMWVQELAWMHGGEVNAKATRVAMNGPFRLAGLHEFLYEDLAENPAFRASLRERFLKARIIIGTFPMVLGRVLLWEGEVRS